MKQRLLGAVNGAHRSQRAQYEINVTPMVDGSYAINGTDIAFSALASRLRELTEGGQRQLLFVRAAPTRPLKVGAGCFRRWLGGAAYRTTRTGVKRSVTVPSPSWPDSLAPQQ